MLNTVVLVGRLTYIYETDSIIEVTTTQPIYKDNEQIGQETVINPVLVDSSMIKNIKDYCNIGNVIGVKGSTKNKDNGIIIVGNKLTFLSSQSADLKGES